MSQTQHAATAIVLLEGAADYLRKQPDAARHVRVVEMACELIAAYAEHFQTTEGIVNKMQEMLTK